MAMYPSNTMIFDGHKFQYAHGVVATGLVIDPETADISDPAYLEALGKAIYWYPKWSEYAYIISMCDMLITEYINDMRGRDSLEATYLKAREFTDSFGIVDDPAMMAIHATLYPDSNIATKYRNQQKRINDQKKQRRAKDRKGFVYLMVSPNGLYKIGKAQDPEIRRKSLSLPGFEIDLIHTIDCKDAYKSERKLHKQYADKRADGEWFALTDDDVREICAIEEL